MSRTRVTTEQRLVLFNFMVEHEHLARGLIAGPHAAQEKKALLQDITDELNAFESGATKTPEKWLKCWHDWKSDVKQKALRIKKYMTHGDSSPSPAALTHLEYKLLKFYGYEEGLPEPDHKQDSVVIRTSAAPVLPTAAPKLTPKRPIKKQDSSSDAELNKFMDSFTNAQGSNPINRHIAFFTGVLPTLDDFDEDEVLEFQVGVLKLLRSIKRSRQNNDSANSPSTSIRIYNLEENPLKFEDD